MLRQSLFETKLTGKLKKTSQFDKTPHSPVEGEYIPKTDEEWSREYAEFRVAHANDLPVPRPAIFKEQEPKKVPEDPKPLPEDPLGIKGKIKTKSASLATAPAPSKSGKKNQGKIAAAKARDAAWDKKAKKSADFFLKYPGETVSLETEEGFTVAAIDMSLFDPYIRIFTDTFASLYRDIKSNKGNKIYDGYADILHKTDAGLGIYDLLYFIGENNRLPTISQEADMFLDMFLGIFLPLGTKSHIVTVLSNAVLLETIVSAMNKYSGSILNSQFEITPDFETATAIHTHSHLSENGKKVIKLIVNTAKVSKEYPRALKKAEDGIAKAVPKKTLPIDSIMNIADTVYYSLIPRLLPGITPGLELDTKGARKFFLKLDTKNHVKMDTPILTDDSVTYLNKEKQGLEKNSALTAGLVSFNARRALAFDVLQARTAFAKQHNRQFATAELDTASRVDNVINSNRVKIISAINDMMDSDKEYGTAADTCSKLVTEACNDISNDAEIKKSAERLEAELNKDSKTRKVIPDTSKYKDRISGELRSSVISQLLSLKELTNEDYKVLKMLYDISISDISVELGILDIGSNFTSETLEETKESLYAIFNHQKSTLSNKGASPARLWAWSFLLHELKSDSASFKNLAEKLSFIEVRMASIKKHGRKSLASFEEVEEIAADLPIISIKNGLPTKEQVAQAKAAGIVGLSTEKKITPKQEKEIAKYNTAVEKDNEKKTQDRIDLITARSKKREKNADSSHSAAEVAAEPVRRASVRATSRLVKKRDSILSQIDQLSTLPLDLSNIYADIVVAIKQLPAEKHKLLSLSAPDEDTLEAVGEIIIPIITDVVTTHFSDAETTNSLLKLSPGLTKEYVEKVLDQVVLDTSEQARLGTLISPGTVVSVSDFDISNALVSFIDLAAAINPEQSEDATGIVSDVKGVIRPNFDLSPAKGDKDGVYYKYFMGKSLPTEIQNNIPVRLLVQSFMMDALVPILEKTLPSLTVGTLLSEKTIAVCKEHFKSPDLIAEITQYIASVKEGISEMKEASLKMKDIIISSFGGQNIVFNFGKSKIAKNQILPKTLVVPTTREKLDGLRGYVWSFFNSFIIGKDSNIDTFVASLFWRQDVSPKTTDAEHKILLAVQLLGTLINYQVGLKLSNISAAAEDIVTEALYDTENTNLVAAAQQITNIRNSARQLVNNRYGDFARALGIVASGSNRHAWTAKPTTASEKFVKNALVQKILSSFPGSSDLFIERMQDLIDFKRQGEEEKQNTPTASKIAESLGIAFQGISTIKTKEYTDLPLEYVDSTNGSAEEEAPKIIMGGSDLEQLSKYIVTAVSDQTRLLTGRQRSRLGKGKFWKNSFTENKTLKESIAKGRKALDSLIIGISKAIGSDSKEDELLDTLKNIKHNFLLLTRFTTAAQEALENDILYTEDTQTYLLNILSELLPVGNLEDEKYNGFFKSSSGMYNKKADEKLLLSMGDPEFFAPQIFRVLYDNPSSLNISSLAEAITRKIIENSSSPALTAAEQERRNNAASVYSPVTTDGSTASSATDSIVTFTQMLLANMKPGSPANFHNMIKMRRQSVGNVNIIRVYCTLHDPDTYAFIKTKMIDAKTALDSKKTELTSLQQKENELSLQVKNRKINTHVVPPARGEWGDIRLDKDNSIIHSWEKDKVSVSGGSTSSGSEEFVPPQEDSGLLLVRKQIRELERAIVSQQVIVNNYNHNMQTIVKIAREFEGMVANTVFKTACESPEKYSEYTNLVTKKKIADSVPMDTISALSNISESKLIELFLLEEEYLQLLIENSSGNKDSIIDYLARLLTYVTYGAFRVTEDGKRVASSFPDAIDKKGVRRGGSITVEQLLFETVEDLSWIVPKLIPEIDEDRTTFLSVLHKDVQAVFTEAGNASYAVPVFDFHEYISTIVPKYNKKAVATDDIPTTQK